MSNGKQQAIRYSIATFVILLSGCQSFLHEKPLHASNGDEMVGQDNRCISREANANNILPVMLYKNMNACVAKASWHDAVYLYALAGSLTWYDAVQVDTQFARSMHSRLLKESMDALDNTQRDIFWQHIQATMSDIVKKTKLCEALIAAGAPTYRPDYMLLSSSGKAGSQEPTTLSWKKAVYSYVDCGRGKLPL